MSIVKTFEGVKPQDIIYALVEFRDENGMVEEIKPIKFRVVRVDKQEDGTLTFTFGNNPLNIGFIDIPEHRVDSFRVLADKYLWVSDENECNEELKSQYNFHIQTAKRLIESYTKRLNNLEKNYANYLEV